VIKVFEDFDLSLVGQMRSVLESHGIRTFLKNEFSTGALGELPFVEAVPQLYVIEDGDAERARSLIEKVSREAVSAGEWTCPRCGEVSDGNFDQCWKCGESRPQTPVG
jgi:rubrerythrin